MEKENMLTPEKMKKAKIGMHKVRTPLQELNIPRPSGSLKKVQYLQITPHASPLHTPPRRLRNANLGYSSPSQICLNALIYKKLDQILEQKTEHHQKEIQAKDAEIARLQEKLQAGRHSQELATSPAANNGPVSYEDIDEISQFVENILESANLEVQEDIGVGDSIARTKSLCDVATSPISCNGSADSHIFENCTECNMKRALSMGALDTPLELSVSSFEKGVATSPISTNCTTPVKVKETCSRGVSTTPVLEITQKRDMGVLTSPRSLVDKAIVMTPVKMQDQEVVTSPVRILSASTVDAEVETKDLVQFAHAGTNTLAVKITANDFCEVGTQTDLEMTTQATSITPKKSASTETCTTPNTPSHTEVAVGTSPLYQALPRFSELQLTGVPPSELASCLETATISNTLLRDELSSLQTRKESLERHLQAALENTKEEKCKIQSARLSAQAALQRELQEVLEQQSMQLNQIAEMQAELTAVKLKADGDLKKQVTIQERLRAENHNLQEDLNRAYKQYKQEINSIKEEYAVNNYKPFYEEAQQKVKELQAQVDAFTELSDVLKDFEFSQMETHKFLEEGFKQLEFKTRQQSEQYRLWEDEYEAWLKEAAEKDVNLNEAIQARDELQQQVTLLEKELSASKERLSKVQAAHEETSLELVHATDQVVDLMEEKYNLSKKLENAEKQRTESQQQLEEAEQLLDDSKSQVSRLHQQLMDCQEKLKRATTDSAASSEVKSELQTTRQQLKAALQLHSMMREHEEFQESELQLQREELAEIASHLEKTRMELAKDKLIADARSDEIVWLNRCNKDLEERVTELVNQLDHTKSQAHNLLMAQNTEITTSLVGLGQMGEVMSALQTTLVSQLSVWAALIEKQKEMKAERMAEMKLTQSQVIAQREAMSDEMHDMTLVEVVHEEEVTTSEEAHKDSEPTGDWFSPTKAAGGLTPAKSFLSQILCALEGVASPLKFEEDFDDEVVVETDQNSNDNALKIDDLYDTDSNTSINSDNFSFADAGQPNIDNASKNCERSDLRTSEESSAFVKIVKNGEPSSSSEEISLIGEQKTQDSANKKLNDVTRTLVDQVYAITQAFRDLYKLVGESSCHGEAYREELEAALERERVMHRRYLVCHTDKLQDMQTQLLLSQKCEAALQQQLNEVTKTKEELELRLQETREQFQKFSFDMHSLAQKESHKMLEKEVMNLQQELQNKDADLAALQESLDSTISRFSGPHSDISSILRESAVLRKEVNRLRTKHLRFRDDAEKVECRLRKKVKVLEDNWQKAENELQFVDHLVDKIRKMLQEHSEVVHWPEHQLLCDLGLLEYTAHPQSTETQNSSVSSSSNRELHLGTPV